MERKARIEALRSEIMRITGRRVSRNAPTSGGVRIVDADDPCAPDSFDGPPIVLPGKKVTGPFGELWLREKRYEPDDVQGTAPISAALKLIGQTAALLALDDSIASFDVRRAVFLDIETTGLSMGTGTIAFLVGLGWFEESSFVVHQLFVNRLENEPAVLATLLERLGKAPMVVTYNGKSFDVPVLRTRLALSRMGVDLDSGGHLDLLHAARRLYKRRIGDCSLDSVERSILGFHREGDIPGELIPEIFVEFLRTGRADHMHDVFHHNLLDVVSMASILGRMVELASSHPDRVPRGDMDDLVSLARVRLRHGDQDHATHILEHASCSGCADHRIESRFELAMMARKRGEHELQRKLLEQLVDDDADHPHAHLMLAKLFEHKLHMLPEALAHAQLTEEAEGFESSAHRVARIQKKIDAGPEGPTAKDLPKTPR
jgi:hypothetical protein